MAEWPAVTWDLTVGDTAPAGPSEGDLWVDTTAAGFPQLKSYDGAAWLDIAPATFAVPVRGSGSASPGAGSATTIATLNLTPRSENGYLVAFAAGHIIAGGGSTTTLSIGGTAGLSGQGNTSGGGSQGVGISAVAVTPAVDTTKTVTLVCTDAGGGGASCNDCAVAAWEIPGNAKAN